MNASLVTGVACNFMVNREIMDFMNKYESIKYTRIIKFKSARRRMYKFIDNIKSQFKLYVNHCNVNLAIDEISKTCFTDLLVPGDDKDP
jgi:hypothetical protein